MHNNISYCRIVVLEKKRFVNIFTLIEQNLHRTPPVDLLLVRDHDFNILETTLTDYVC